MYLNGYTCVNLYGSDITGDIINNNIYEMLYELTISSRALIIAYNYNQEGVICTPSPAVCYETGSILHMIINGHTIKIMKEECTETAKSVISRKSKMQSKK